MKILWMSDSPTAPSSYGNVTRYVCAGLADRGHEVSILSWKIQGQPVSWQNCMLYPIGLPTDHSADELLNYLRQLRPDILITVADIWTLTHFNFLVTAKFLHTTGIPWVLYYPIDADMEEKRLPPSWVHILKSIDLPIAMSHYGRDVTQANGVVPAYIPHGVDTKVFQLPVDKQVAKQALGYEGKFVVLSDIGNQLHKMLPQTLEIFQHFAVDKDDVILHLHCDPDDPAARSPLYCYDLRSDIAFLNLTDKVRFTKDMSLYTGLPLAQLAHIYQAADVHLLTSLGEGFGLSTLQAAAAGAVPLAPDSTASQELVQGHGEAISIRHFLLDQLGLRRGLVDIDDAVSKLEILYRDRDLLACKAQSAREFALSYDWEHIVSQWEVLLQRELQLRQENIQLERILSIPMTLPLAKSKQRVSGCVHVASQRDVPVVLALHRIFPELKVWSTIPLDFTSSLSNGQPLQTKVVQANSPQYRPHLAVSTLALDLGSLDPHLPSEAAKLGVPCIGLAQHKEQVWLWPELSLHKPDPLMAAKLGRQILTDQGVATDLCLAARQHLTGALTPTSDKPLGSVTT